MDYFINNLCSSFGGGVKIYNKMKHSLLLKATYVASILSAAIVLYLSYLLLWPIHILDMKTVPLKVKTPKVRAGEALVLELNYCKNAHVSAINTYSFLDHNAVPSIVNRSNLPVGCHKREVEIITPIIIIPGKYSLLYTAEYQVNPLRPEKYQWESEQFEILPASDGAQLKKKPFKTLSFRFTMGL